MADPISIWQIYRDRRGAMLNIIVRECSGSIESLRDWPMRRPFIFLLPVLLGQCVDGSMPALITPLVGQRIEIASRPVPLDTSDPKRRRLGALTLIGAWQLTSTTRGFGGLSALDVDGNRVTALGDGGTIVRFRLGRFGKASDAAIMPVPAGCGRVLRKADNDTEALTHDAARNQWWIGYEWRNAVCRTNADLTSGMAVRIPHEIAVWHPKRGVEAMTRLNDGRFLIIAESVSSTTGVAQAFLFDRDPTDPAARSVMLGYRPKAGFKPTDMAQLPDGRLLILNRRFTPWNLFTSDLTIADAIGNNPVGVFRGTSIARFDAPIITENFEGISVSVENGKPIVWLVSDNNFMRWQRTLLLKFALD